MNVANVANANVKTQAAQTKTNGCFNYAVKLEKKKQLITIFSKCRQNVKIGRQRCLIMDGDFLLMIST